MATTLKGVLGTQITPFTAGTALANNALAVSAAINNTAGGGGTDGYKTCRLTLNGQFTTSPTASTGLSVWLLTSEDGGNTYEDGGASYTPTRIPDCVIQWAAVATAQQVTQFCDLPAGFFKVLVKNDGSGQSLNAGWTLKLLPTTDGGF